MAESILSILGLVVPVLHGIGLVMAVDAIWRSRTPQGAIAWACTLGLFPFVAIPLYLVFGRNRFYGYASARRIEDQRVGTILRELTARVLPYRAEIHDQDGLSTLEALARMPFTRGNRLELLVDGPATFEAIFSAMERAQDYILIQFFIVRDDELGRELQRRLIDKARAGIRVYFLYDEIGSHALPRSYASALRTAGVSILPFHTRKGPRNRFQLNFRNHRKIVVVDGREAFVGGHNVADEYVGRSKIFGHWRDTHVKIVGPAVQGVQLAFLEDWYWAAGEVPDLVWEPRAEADSSQNVLALRSGPADDVETCGLYFVQAIQMARKRLWIASPYFVPDPQVMAALQLAALRGVDVRILLPATPDHILVYLSTFSYIDEVGSACICFYRYQAGFLHQKVMLIDDHLASVGTANLDNRSIRLNFEINIMAADDKFAADVREMLERDLAQCERAYPGELAKRSFWFRLAVRVARLAAPVQ